MRLLTVVAAVAAIINNAVLAAPMPEVPEPTITPTPTYLNQTYVYYPQATDWFTLGATNTIQWAWASTTKSNLRIVLSNANATRLAKPMVLVNSTPAADFQVATPNILEGPLPGNGYVVALYDADSSSSNAICTSASFEIKPVGSKENTPTPFLVPSNGASAFRAGTAVVLLAVAAALMV